MTTMNLRIANPLFSFEAFIGVFADGGVSICS